MLGRFMTTRWALLFLLLTGCGGSGSTPAPLSHQPSTTTPESEIIAEAMASLRPEDRGGDLVVFANGQIYATSAEARSTAFYYQPTNDPDVFLDASGTPVVFPPMDDASITASGLRRLGVGAGEGGGTGVSHRWYSKLGYTYMSADVSIPCASSQLNGTTTDVNGGSLPKQAGYIYGGGISGTNAAADVGIQFNAQDGKIAPPKSVQEFIRAQQNTASPVGAYHLKCDATYQLTSYVTEIGGIPNLVDVLQKDGTGDTHVMTEAVSAASGWHKVCNQCRTKRVTALAVKPAGQQQTIVGTWFGVQQPYANSVPTITWSGVVQSFFSSSAAGASVAPPVPWFEDQTVSQGGDTPTNAQDTGLFVVLPEDFANETVGINESGPHLILK